MNFWYPVSVMYMLTFLIMFIKTSQFFSKDVSSSINIKNLIKTLRYFRSNVVLKENESTVEPILVEKDENITLIGINRPKQRNAINLRTAEKLSVAISEFEADNSSPVAVLYGVGGSLCAGYDIRELESQCAKGSLDFLLRHEGSIGPTRRHSRKPIICGISGFCVASGLELALMCDLRVMEETAILGFFNRRFGVPMSDGGTVRLASMVGHSTALDLVISGRRITGKEALEIGLINRLVATGTALGQSVNLAFSIAKYPQASILQDRNAIYTNTFTRHNFATAVQTEIMNTSKEVLAELKEGVQRFKKSEIKGSKTDSFQVKLKNLPDWENSEIEYERKKELNKNSK